MRRSERNAGRRRILLGALVANHISLVSFLAGMLLVGTPGPALAQNPGGAVQNAGTILVSARVEEPAMGRILHGVERYADSVAAGPIRRERRVLGEISRQGVRVSQTVIEPREVQAAGPRERGLRISLEYIAN